MFRLEQFFLTRDFPIFSSSSSSSSFFFFIFFFLSHRPRALRKRGKRLIFTPNISTGDGGVHRHQAIDPFLLYYPTTKSRGVQLHITERRHFTTATPFRVRAISLSVTQSAFASTSDRPLCFPRACVGLIGPRPSDYPHALSACYYFLPAVFLLALGLWSSLPARQLSLDTPYSFLTFSVFFFFFFSLKY